MTIRANKFTPEVLLSAPRRSSAIPNSDGTLALYTVSTYFFDSHAKSAEIRVLDIATGHSTALCKDLGASDPTWLGDGSLVVWLQGGEKGMSSLMLGDAATPDKKPARIANFDGPTSNLKILSLDAETYIIALTGLATPSGTLYNPEMAQKMYSSGRVYSGPVGFVRHWDSYCTENRSSIFVTTLKKAYGHYRILPTGLINALKASPYRLESPVPPFGGMGDFDISESGLVFVAKDPKLNEALYTKTDLYFVPQPWKENTEAIPQIVKTGNLLGYCNSPVFSPNGKSVAFTRMKSDTFESDKPRLMLLPDIEDLTNVQEFFETEDGEGSWDIRVGAILWSQDGKELYVTAEEEGRDKLWKVPSSPRHAISLPSTLTTTGSVVDAKWLAKGDSKLLISCTSLVDNSCYCVLDPSSAKPTIHQISSSSKGGKTFGLSQQQVSDFWFQGAEDYKVHAWLVKPSTFSQEKTYPLAYLIHGGPQGAWTESWSTRWNPAVFAEQGYVVVTVNFTGSSGYGMAFLNAITDNWGNRPYKDLEAGLNYIEANMKFVDTSRAVALGASYGGFMVNYIQGMPLGRRFKCLVTHDGVFSTLNQYSSEELFFPNHDFGGPFWKNRAGYEKWDPARLADNWATPHFVIHNELDYRLPISEGLAAFNVLQAKGVECKFLTFPDENHFVLKPENSLVWHREVFNWINKYSGVEDEQAKLEKSIAGLEF